jgi:HEAT repeat protein
VRLADLGGRADLSVRVRAQAARALVASGHPRFLAALQARLGAEDPRVVAAAALAMGLSRRREAVEPLIELLARSPHAPVRAAAAEALGLIGDARAVEILEAAVRGEQVMVAAIGALGRLGSPAQVPLLSVTLRDRDAEVRLATASALAEIIARPAGADFTDLVPYLKVALERESEPRVAAVILACFSRLGAELPPDLVARALGL